MRCRIGQLLGQRTGGRLSPRMADPTSPHIRNLEAERRPASARPWPRRRRRRPAPRPRPAPWPASARPTSIWSASSATSERIVTWFADTSTKPPCTATTTSSSARGGSRRVWMSRAPMNGAWPGRKAMSPPPSVRRDDHVGLAREEDPLRADELDLHGAIGAQPSWSSAALARAASASPTLRNACSGRSSRSPLTSCSKRLDGLLDRDVDALEAGEHLAHEERLGQEPLHLAGPVDGDAVLLGQLVEAEDGDDVLQLLVALEDLLHPAGHVVVALADDLGRRGSSRSTPAGRPPGRCRGRRSGGTARWWRRGG